MDKFDLSQQENFQSKNGLIDTAIEKAMVKLRRKPGPQKKEDPRSEKISCRLTKSERALGENYCKKHGITEAKLLRASYLAAIAEIPNDRLIRLVDTLMPLENLGLTTAQKTGIQSRAKEVLKRSAVVLLLILMGAASGPYVVKEIWGAWDGHSSYLLHKSESCVMFRDRPGCAVIAPRDNAPPQNALRPLDKMMNDQH